MGDFSTYSAERDFARQVKKAKEDCATTLDESLDHLQDEFNALLSEYDAFCALAGAARAWEAAGADPLKMLPNFRVSADEVEEGLALESLKEWQ